MKEYIVKDNIAVFDGMDFPEMIRCRDCKKWKRNDGTLPDFDGKEWHECEALDEYRNIYTSENPITPSWFYCGYAERKEEETKE